MLSTKDNEQITRVGPGTPMGETLRRYWVPILLDWELPRPDCDPVRVRILGEDLVAFKDTHGRIGLLANECPHRRVSLYFGRNEEGGLRCVYHGWKFDVDGQCMEQPNEPEGSNFAHKVRCYTYLLRLGRKGIRRMSAMAVLAARYLYEHLKLDFPMLPPGANNEPRMHEFILTLSDEDFDRIEAAGVPRAQIIPQIGKLFLDFGFHAPTVAFPEIFGLMIEPTESYTRVELDRFAEAVKVIGNIARKHPQVLKNAPHFTPIDRVDEVAANRNPVVSEPLRELPAINPNRLDPEILQAMSIQEIRDQLVATPAG